MLDATLANLMFSLSAMTHSQRQRRGPALQLAELATTDGPIAPAVAPISMPGAVPSSTSFANPAVTVGWPANVSGSAAPFLGPCPHSDVETPGILVTR